MHSLSRPNFRPDSPSTRRRRLLGSQVYANNSFTLIEILIVIGIIAVLLALLFGALALTLRIVREHQTRAILGDLNNMIQEAELSKPLPDLLNEPTLNGRPDLQAVYPTYQTQLLAVGSGPAFAGDPTDSAKPAHWPAYAVVTSYPRVQGRLVLQNTQHPDAAQYTAYVLYQLCTIPKNRELLAKMPSSRFKTITVSQFPIFPMIYTAGVGTYSANPVNWPQDLPNGSTSMQLPCPVDAWGHYIYFVPGGGIYNDVSTTTPGLPSGLCSNVKDTTATNLNGYKVNPTPVTAPGEKSFFVSAGEDGDLLQGDDNQYSFSQ